MLRSMYSGISGLRNFQTKLDVIGNNIANVNTYGFKKGRTIFKDLISQSVAGASAGSMTRGGVNPKQVGLGSQISAIDTIHSGGSTQFTGNTLDLAVSGDGFFQVADSSGAGRNGFSNPLYTRAGNFYMDNEGYLVNSDGKFLVGGITQVDATVLAAAQVAAATAQATAAADAETASADAKALAEEILIKDGELATAKTDLAADQTNQTLKDAVTAAEKALKDAKDSTIAGGEAEAAALSLAAAEASAIAAAEAASAVADLINPQPSNVIRNPQATGSLDVGGSYLPDIPLTVNGTYAPIKIPTDAQSMSVGQDGTVTFVDAEGKLRWAGQLVMAKFPNPGGMDKVGGNYFRDTANSGTPIIQTATQSGIGAIESGFLEMSNVDLAEEFTEMIVAQRGFQANTRIITTSDEILQELVNLKR